MDLQIIQQWITNIGIIVGALLAIDNILDGVFKAFGYQEGDTFCGQIAELLNRTKKQLPTDTTKGA